MKAIRPPLRQLPSRDLMTEPDVGLAYESLDKCGRALKRLSDNCCEPGRSPRMKRLAETLEETRTSLREAGSQGEFAVAAIEKMEDAGTQLGSLQVGCCALSRMPLYAEMLEELTKAQRAVTKAYGLGH